MNIRVVTKRGDVEVITEVEGVELHQLASVVYIVKDGWMPTQEEAKALRWLA